MAEIKFPIKIDGFKCVEDMAQAVLNYTYKGKTLKEWADSISEPQTNADHIRAMSDEELARFITDDLCELFCGSPSICDGQCEGKMLSWLKAPAEEGEG